MKALHKGREIVESFSEAAGFRLASMKALPKRKGNSTRPLMARRQSPRLDESPSQKEGKLFPGCFHLMRTAASMKAPTKSMGNRKRASFSPSVSHPLNESPSK